MMRGEGSGVKIASVTLAGNNADIIGDALRSVVDEVDLCVLVLTSPVIADGTEDVARLVAGDKLRVWRKPWREDFGYMRTAAMELAAKSRADWGIWLDTDERIVCAKPGAIRELVTAADPSPVDAISCWHVSGEYSKERLLRLPLRGTYYGLTHEYWKPVGEPKIGNSRGLVRFDELPKDDAAFAAKNARDLDLLERQIALEPEEPRWLFYQGGALKNLHREGEALGVFLACMNASVGWGELRGWAAFRACELLLTADEPDPDAALQVACQGMALCPYAELDWVAAYSCLLMEDYPSAIIWANKAIAGGRFVEGWGRGVHRTGHVFPPALYEAPFAVHVEALTKLGQTDAAAQAQRQFAEALAMRESA